MESFYEKLQSISTFLKLSFNTMSKNIVLFLIMSLCASLTHFFLQPLISNLSSSKFVNFVAFALSMLIYTIITVISAYVVRCEFYDEQFDTDEIKQILVNNSLSYVILTVLITVGLGIIATIIVVLIMSIVLAIYGVILLIPTVIIIIYGFVKYKFCMQLTAFYDIGAFTAASKSKKLTKSMFFKLLLLYVCLIGLAILISTVFFSKIMIFPAVLQSILNGFLTVFYAVFDAYVALNILCMRGEVEEYYEHDNYSNYQTQDNFYDNRQNSNLNSNNNYNNKLYEEDTEDDNIWNM